jgi:hypothetical protein
MNSRPAIQNTLKRVGYGPNPFERVSHVSRRIHSMALQRRFISFVSQNIRGHDPRNTRLTLDR